ncbi:MAG TPA: hypothetical protein VHT96_06515 [Clostridia bacterium]|nr:hypothetical protein [Clostridia bacterium]
MPDNINDALKDLLAGLSPNSAADPKSRDGKKSCGANADAGGINPSQALIIGAMLAGVLEVTSVLIDRNQTIEIVLTGSLKRKTELEKILDQIGSKTLDEVVKAMLGRLGIP